MSKRYESDSMSLYSNNLEIPGGVQMQGILSKKPVGHQSNKWSKRFCVIKDGYLLYYAETQKKVFEETKTFNIHPKGVIPLGNCNIEGINSQGVANGICIQLPDHKTSICLAAEHEEKRNIWLKEFEKATKVTFENCQLGEAMIQSLHQQSLQLVKEKQHYVDKFIFEAEELGVEREQKKALEEFNQQLAEEKERIQLMVTKLHDAHTEIKIELEETHKASQILENDRKTLVEETEQLKKSMLELDNEHTTILQLLEEQQEFNNKDDTKGGLIDLQSKLVTVLEKTKQLEMAKKEVDQRLQENQQISLRVCQENDEIVADASKLKIDIQMMTEQKETIEEQLKEEINARIQLQKELEMCKCALKRLEKDVLKQPDDAIQAAKDVQSLKDFFENCALESKLELEKAGPAKNRISRRITTKRHNCSHFIYDCGPLDLTSEKARCTAVPVELELTPTEDFFQLIAVKCAKMIS